jgi:small conductance mechanosensitive channel
LSSILNSKFAQKYFTEQNFDKCFEALVILVIGYIIIRVLIRIERHALEKSDLDPVNYVLVIRATRIVLWLMLIMVILPTIGISTAPLVTLVGTIGVAVALALKDSLSNVASGIIMVFTKPFVKGDVIKIGGTTGVVDYIDMLSTRLHTFDNQVVIVPNKEITNSILINITKMDLHRVDVTFDISYESDIERAKELIQNIIKNSDLFLNEPAPIVGVNALGESGVKIDAFAWCRTEDRLDAKYFLQEEVKKQFDNAGIVIPFTTIEVRVDQVNENK